MARKPMGSGGAGRGAELFGGSGGGGEGVLTVSQVAVLVKAVLAEAVPGNIRVVGEVSNFSDRTHWYFSLKDEGATLRCVCFATQARRVGFRLADGMEVVATGRLDFYDAQGSVQLYVEKIEPVGQGALELRLRALMEELRKLGYFEVGRKKALPLMPGRVAVVTSRTGAALQDVVNTTRKRWGGCELVLVDVRVQGEGAAEQVARAIGTLSEQGAAMGIEAIILTRGGGSIEDLWAFNERVVADAIYKCRLPVVAAIGHETDTTIAELVADVRCATPTQAAMTVVPDRKALDRQVSEYAQRLGFVLKRNLMHSRQRIEGVARHVMFRRPGEMVRPWRERLDAGAEKLAAVLPGAVKAERDRLDALGRHLESVNPKKVLQRGYSYTVGADGHVVKSTRQVRGGERITTVLADGRVVSVVEGAGDGVEGVGSGVKSSGAGGKSSELGVRGSAFADRKLAGQKKRGRKRGTDDGPGLFGEGGF